MPLEIGVKAPGFTLTDTEGNSITLSDQKDAQSVVLLFFPLAFSNVCTKELCMTRDNMKLYESLNTRIFAISVDSFFTLNAFKKSQNLNFVLLSDFNREVSKMYDVLYEDYFGMKNVSKRAVYLIDKTGNIRYRQILENSDQLPDFNKLREEIHSLSR